MTMPHMSSGGSEDFYSTDEVKVYKDEGNKDEEKRSSENLNEEKLGLVTESEEGKNAPLQGNYTAEKSSNAVSDDDKAATGPVPTGQAPPGSLGFFLPPYAPAYPNGSAVGKFGMVQPPYPGLVMYNDFAQPPPAHKGYPPVYTDPKTGLPRPSMYAAYPAPGQFPHPLYAPEFTSSSWHRPSGYPLTSGAFPGSFPPSLSSLSRYGHPGLLSHPGLSHPAIPHPSSLGAGGPKSELMSSQLLQDSHRHLCASHGDENSGCGKNSHHHAGSSVEEQQQHSRRKPYVKKPLNAFMLFMKEMRPKVISECTLKESAAINQILGRRWHALDRTEQAKYYEMARKEKELHLQLYPGWSARDNYAAHQKKKKRKKESLPPGMRGDGGSMGMGSPLGSPLGSVSGINVPGSIGARCMDLEIKPGECPNEKKCRARYGMDQQSRWCKPCRRKKKCIRYKQSEDGNAEEDDDEEDMEEALARDLTLDSSAYSGCESDSTTAVDSPAHPAKRSRESSYNSSILSDRVGMGSPLSPIIDDEEESENDGAAAVAVKGIGQHQSSRPSSLVPSSSCPSPVAFPATSSPRQQPQRHFTPHSIDSFLFSPSPLRLPYPLPPSPLALPLPYIGFPPFQYPHPHSPHTPRTPNGSPFSLDIKPII